MPLPALSRNDALLEERLPALSSGTESPVDRATFYIQCPGCGFSGSDGAFTAYPAHPHLDPASLLTFIRAETAAGHARKCPECHAAAKVLGARWHIGCPSREADLVVDCQDSGLRLVMATETSKLQNLDERSPVLQDACLDSQERAARLLSEIDPDRHDEAERLLLGVIRARPKAPLPLLALARLHLLREHDEAALSALERAAPLSGGEPTAAAELASLLAESAHKNGDEEVSELALTWLETALRYFPTHPVLRLHLGRLHLARGHSQEARTSLELALPHEATSFEAARELARLAIREGRGQEAHHLCAQLLELDEKDEDIRRLAAWSAHLVGNRQEAEALLSDLKRDDPTSVETQELIRLLLADPSPITGPSSCEGKT